MKRSLDNRQNAVSPVRGHDPARLQVEAEVLDGVADEGRLTLLLLGPTASAGPRGPAGLGRRRRRHLPRDGDGGGAAVDDPAFEVGFIRLFESWCDLPHI